MKMQSLAHTWNRGPCSSSHRRNDSNRSGGDCSAGEVDGGSGAGGSEDRFSGDAGAGDSSEDSGPAGSTPATRSSADAGGDAPSAVPCSAETPDDPPPPASAVGSATGAGEGSIFARSVSVPGTAPCRLPKPAAEPCGAVPPPRHPRHEFAAPDRRSDAATDRSAARVEC